MAMKRRFSPVDGVSVTFREAGHILGSAQVILDIQEKGRKYRWLFSGDVGRGNDELLRDPVPVEKCGLSPDRIHLCQSRGTPPRIDADSIVAQAVSETIAKGGKIIIPAFFRGAHPANRLCAA